MRAPKRNMAKASLSIAVVMDGATEKWYLDMLKQMERHIRVSIRPEIPNNKNVEEQYELVEKLLKQEHDYIVWIVDLDVILKHSKDCKKGAETPLQAFVKYRNKLAKHKHVVCIVNNPCIEYWFLLHYMNTTKYFAQGKGVEQELKKYIPDYEKSERYFKKTNQDIYSKLKPNLSIAINNARQLGDFDANDSERAYCEMYKLFDLPPFRSILDK